MDSIIKEALYVIRKSKEEWEKRYDQYANEFIKNEGTIRELSRKFREYPPLRFYISTSNVKDAKKSLSLDIRYRGQSIATLTAKDDNVTISTKGKEDNNLKHFEFPKKLDNVNWNSEEAQDFRKFFKSREDSRNNAGKNNEEHNVEQLLLTEFSKSIKDEKIKYIQPVTICGMRYGMPTPISASNHKESLKYSEHRGGGIDVLARTGRGNNNSYLTVIEVKDENKNEEPPKYALEQAIQYAIFIRELLRSKSGDNWYEIFGFGGKVPKKLTIRVACAMPDTILDTSFAKVQYKIEDGNEDIIECHYIYFKYGGMELSDFQTSLNQ